MPKVSKISVSIGAKVAPVDHRFEPVDMHLFWEAELEDGEDPEHETALIRHRLSALLDEQLCLAIESLWGEGSAPEKIK